MRWTLIVRHAARGHTDVVRHGSLTGPEGAILYARFGRACTDEVIGEQVDYFEGIGQGFEWTLRGSLCDCSTATDQRQVHLVGGCAQRLLQQSLHLTVEPWRAQLVEAVEEKTAGAADQQPSRRKVGQPRPAA